MKDHNLDNNRILLDKHLRGQLKEDELKVFNEKMQNSEFNAQVRQEEKIVEAIKTEGFLDIVGMLEREEAKIQSAKKTTLNDKHEAPIRSLSFRRYASVAAVVLFVLAIGGLWWTSNSYSDVALASRFYEEAGSPETLGFSKSQYAIFKDGLFAFNQKNYAEAIKELSAIQEKDAKYIDAQYFLGHAYFKLKKYDQAIEKFEFILARNQLPFYIERPEVEWNLLLNYMGSETFEEDAFRAKLEKILQSPNHPKYKNAQVLDRKLQSFWRRFLF